MTLDTEYTAYEKAMARLDALMGVHMPVLSREEYADMAELLDARMGVFA